VVPSTHRGEALPPIEREHESLPGEVAVYASAGDAVFTNAAIWHTGGRNRGEGLRRTVYLDYGYWWLRRFDVEGEKHRLPWQALEGASEGRLQLLGQQCRAPLFICTIWPREQERRPGRATSGTARGESREDAWRPGVEEQALAVAPAPGLIRG
jgi:ectoine hydroxylase-related dioxygenase (phytanoyl-CoA dioxygenase family)